MMMEVFASYAGLDCGYQMAKQAGHYLQQGNNDTMLGVLVTQRYLFHPSLAKQILISLSS